jgi:hypothetical protein
VPRRRRKRRSQRPIHIDLIWPGSPGEPRCSVCSSPITLSSNGRRRLTCSDACRQKRYRHRKRHHRDVEPNRNARAADRLLRRAERSRGRADETPLYVNRRITRRDQILFDLRFGVPLENCQWCARPMTLHAGFGGRRRCCSKYCREKFLEYCHRFDDAMIRAGRHLDPIVKMRLRDFVFYGDKPPAVLRFEVNICDHCRMPYPVYGLTSRFCSKRCRQAAWRSARRLCKYCGRRFKFRPGGKKQLYCSKACKSRSRRVPTPADRACEVCHKVFTPNRFHPDTQCFCSARCKSAHWSSRRPYQRVPAISGLRPCVACGKPFEVNQYNHTKRLYCSRRCIWRAFVNRRALNKKPSPDLERGTG